MPLQYNEIRHRFRRFLPVVVDIETGGLDNKTSPILEIAIHFLKLENSVLTLDDHLHYYIKPFSGAKMDPESIKFIGYKENEITNSIDEHTGLLSICEQVKERTKKENCTRAILVGHNAHFDLSFFNTAMERCQLKSPFHQFSTIDTVSISALIFGQTVLCQACKIAGIDWDNSQAHNALYDCTQTAKLFCHTVNQTHQMQTIK
jgi:ribonuclease T